MFTPIFPRCTPEKSIVFKAIWRKVFGKMWTQKSWQVRWDMINTLFLTLLLSNLLFLLSFSTRRHTSMASRVILSNFFEEQWQYLSIPFPQYFSGLSSAHFPTTFLKISEYHPSILFSYFLCDSYSRLDYRKVYIVTSVTKYPLSFLNSRHLYFCLRLSLLNKSFKDRNN